MFRNERRPLANAVALDSRSVRNKKICQTRTEKSLSRRLGSSIIIEREENGFTSKWKNNIQEARQSALSRRQLCRRETKVSIRVSDPKGATLLTKREPSSGNGNEFPAHPSGCCRRIGNELILTVSSKKLKGVPGGHPRSAFLPTRLFVRSSLIKE